MLAVAAFALGLAAMAPRPAVAAPDPTKVIGPDECGECHKNEVRIWRGTTHYKTFQELPRKDKAREIADKLGIKRIKSESLCLNCHFTEKVAEDGSHDAIAGISCESCHGAARDWNKIHSDYGGKDVKRENETPEHKAKRLADSRAAGMIQPSMMFEWASNCFGCHTVPEEKLVNVGGHPAGSKFELVTWSQGEIRHNVWNTDGKSNPEASPEQKRQMLVLGQALELAQSLRGVAKATQKADYAVAMAGRAKGAAQRLQAISKAATTPEIDSMLQVAGSVQLKLDNAAELNGAADRISELARQFLANNDGSGLAALDAIMPKPDAYKGTPAQ